jgi:hypothetical protein
MVMLLVAALASFIVLTMSVAVDSSDHHRSQPVSLSVARHIDPHDRHHAAQRDQRRSTHLRNRAGLDSSSDLTEGTAELPLNETGSTYEAKVGFGNPPIYCESRVDFLSGI